MCPMNMGLIPSAMPRLYEWTAMAMATLVTFVMVMVIVMGMGMGMVDMAVYHTELIMRATYTREKFPRNVRMVHGARLLRIVLKDIGMGMGMDVVMRSCSRLERMPSVRTCKSKELVIGTGNQTELKTAARLDALVLKPCLEVEMGMGMGMG